MSAKFRRKLIEVALPLDEINAACKADKDRKSGTLRSVHKWFAPMPLPAWRALLLAALLDDPETDERRVYLLDVIKRLMASGADLPSTDVLSEASDLLQRQYPDGLPIVLDPFCGGGSTLVEAQRLGLESHGGDLNPVPALISRVLTQVLPPVFGHQPVAPEAHKAEVAPPSLLSPSPNGRVAYQGYQGLIRDAKHFAATVMEAVREHLVEAYPAPYAGEAVQAYFWGTTAVCPNPACGARTILSTTWWLSKRKGALAWVEPQVQGREVELAVISRSAGGTAPPPPKAGRGVFTCLVCSSLLDERYLRSEGLAGRLGHRLLAVISDRAGDKHFRPPTQAEEQAALEARPSDDVVDQLRVPLVGKAAFNLSLYGHEDWSTVFTGRQQLLLATVTDEIAALNEQLASATGITPAYREALISLMGLAVGRLAQYQSTQVRWFIDSRSGGGQPLPAFARHDLPMQWDFIEPAPASNAGSLAGAMRSVTAALAQASAGSGVVEKVDARTVRTARPALVATDPPYFDAIGYADLSDYFYIWHRRALRSTFPDLYATAATPKAQELTALPWRHSNDRSLARQYFIDGFTEVFLNLKGNSAPDLPMLVVYASKEQKAGAEEGRWSSILSAIIAADLQITGTWPILGARDNRMIGLDSNAVATYVVMACRPRPIGASTIGLIDFNRHLRRDLGPAVRDLQNAGILPVDLAQAALGPGMQVFSRHQAVLDQRGQAIPVEQALRLINAALGEVLDEQEGELDAYSRFAVGWWDRFGWSPGPFGDADKLARPQGIAVDDLVRAGVINLAPNRVTLRGRDNLDRSWSPESDSLPTAWEAVHHLADRLLEGGGAADAGRLLGKMPLLRDPARSLVYRLHHVAGLRSRSKDQERYNALIASWSDLLALSATENDGLF